MAAPHNNNVKDKILSAAASLLDEKTFGDISLAEIAARAGISKGSVYYYYKSKEFLLYDVADAHLEAMYDDLEQWVNDDSKDTSLPRLIRYIIERGVSGSGRNLRLNLTADAANGDTAIREKLLARYRLFCEEIGKLVVERRRIDSEIYTKKQQEEFFGLLMIILIDGLMIQSLLGNQFISEKDFASYLIDMFVN
ncbi:MAG: TetR/AcrR family transcriptional regulator [Peptostreptococcaceae bacterium]|nr:TetR/AcrR family transcriptional regulator [Peptostreptococcaceae bacterium]MDY5739450.1 TetR/AcrR family transcriptional regulator [Anaerovoracaceae bacterium]SFE52007.1 transcriptional regulator, TetR family [Peptostreptococcaceae bacterium pGA-8]